MLRSQVLRLGVVAGAASSARQEQLRPVTSSLSLSEARKIADGVLQCGHRHELLPLAVVVVDSGGNDVVVLREDGCGVLRSKIARGKAYAALSMGMSSRAIRDRLRDRPAFQGALSDVAEGRFVPVPGGVLILDAKGRALGAVGVSGDTSDKDEMAAIVAVSEAELMADPPEPAANWPSSSLGGR